MKYKTVDMSLLPLGSYGKVVELKASGNQRRRMLDLGLIPNTVIEAVQESPSGDPKAYAIRGAIIALRSEEASKIIVEVIS